VTDSREIISKEVTKFLLKIVLYENLKKKIIKIIKKNIVLLNKSNFIKKLATSDTKLKTIDPMIIKKQLFDKLYLILKKILPVMI
tara:strand:+ start:437 stop:691 length:255 start_codon:yes stop_codon:yes gene_type:complete